MQDGVRRELGAGKTTLGPADYKAHRRRLYSLWCRLYFVMGVVSIGSGIVMAVVLPRYVRGLNSYEQREMHILGAVFIVFGIARMINSVVVMRRMQRQ